MFKYIKNRRKEAQIRYFLGVELHRQITTAVNCGGHAATERLQTCFVVGYIFYFVSTGFMEEGFMSDNVTDKHLQHICDGILPKKLYAMLQKQLSAYEISQDIAQSIGGPDNKIPGTTTSPAEQKNQFDLGCEVGIWDSQLLSNAGEPSNLLHYLLGESMMYRPMIKT